MPIKLITGPSVEPVSIAEVKTSARIDGTEFDTQATIAIAAIAPISPHSLSPSLAPEHSNRSH